METNKELPRLDNRLRRLFHKACADYGLIADGDHILVGLSGGKDSLALVEMLGRRARIHVPSFRVTALHVCVENIGYRSDTAWLEAFCRAWGVPFVQRTTRYDERPEGRQQKNHCFLCSWYRRKALFDAARELGCNKLALGHHKDDIVETLLMNLIYQGAVATIAPMMQMEKMPLQVIRPLCLIEERDLREYARLREYPQVPKLCPYEHDSSRSEVKKLVTQLEQFNPEVRDSLWGAMHNIKTDYLPQRICKKH